MRIFFTVAFTVYLILGSLILYSQVNPDNYFSMDGCDLLADVGTNSGIYFGPNPCACGVSSNGLSFDGSADFAEFDESINSTFSGDWSLTFYIKVDNLGSQSVDILHLGNECSLDSVLSLRYLPGSQRFRFRLSSSENNSAQVDGLADINSCWKYIAITKEQAVISLYINGQLVESSAAVSDLAFSTTAPLFIANSPCLSIAVNPDAKFQGSIDEFKLFDRVLSEREIQFDNLQPDKILTRDTTIFIGTSLTIQTGGTCFQDFSWTPTDGLNDPNLLNATASPTSDVTYMLTINGDNCQSTDQVTIRVADPSQITCNDLVLPTAFTPNNDQINDRYGISNQFLISQLLSFEIFNKWGGRVFYAEQQSDTWDGNYQGAPAPPNPYMYRVEYVCDGASFVKTGTVNLIR